MNNLLKTLHGYYFKDLSSNCNVPLTKVNQCEFIGYFVLNQIGNGGEVTKYLQRLPLPILQSKELTFAISVWTAIRSNNYAKFFKLLIKGNILQKCLMFKYLGDVRLNAVKKLLKSYYVQSKTPIKIHIPVHHFTILLLFDNDQQTIEFFQHCGISLKMGENNDTENDEEEVFVSVEGQNIDYLLPKDVNGFAVPPKVPMISNLVQQALRKKDGSLLTTQDVCRGLFKENGTVKPFSAAAVKKTPLTAVPPPAATATPAVKKPTIRIIPAASKIAPATAASAPSQPAPLNPPLAGGVKPVQQAPFNPPAAPAPVPVPFTFGAQPVAGTTPLNATAKPFVPGGGVGLGGADAAANPFAKPVAPQTPVFSNFNNAPQATGPAALPHSVHQPFSSPLTKKEEIKGLGSRQPSKDLTHAAVIRAPSVDHSVPINPLTRQRTSDTVGANLMPPPSGLPQPPLKERVPSVQTATASAPLGGKALPLLSAASVDEFIKRTSTSDNILNDLAPPPQPLSRNPSAAIPVQSSFPAGLSTPREPLKRQPSTDIDAPSPRLLQLERQFLQKRKQSLVKRVFLSWLGQQHSQSKERSIKLKLFLMRRYLQYWRKVFDRTTQSRRMFFQNIQSINLTQQQPVGTTLSSSALMVITPPTATTSYGTYVPPYRRGQSQASKRKPLRDYSILSAESVVLSDQLHSLSIRQQETDEGEEPTETSEDALAGEVADEGRAFRGSGGGRGRGRGGRRRAEEGAYSSSFSFLFQSTFTDLCGVALFLQQTKHYQHSVNLTTSTLATGTMPTPLRLDHFLADKSFNNAASLQENVVYLKNDYFTLTSSPSSAISSPFWWPSDVYGSILLITPARRRGVFVNFDCPLIAAYRSLFTNAEGFFANFRKKTSKISQKSFNDEEEKDEELLFQERIQLLRAYQNYDPLAFSKFTDYEDISEEMKTFQLGTYHTNGSNGIQLVNERYSKQSQGISRQTHLTIEESTFTDACSAVPDSAQRHHLHLLFLSNFYHQQYQINALHQYARTALTSPSLPRVAVIILYTPSISEEEKEEDDDDEEEILLEFTSFPTIHDVFGSCQVNGIKMTDRMKSIVQDFFDDRSLVATLPSGHTIKDVIRNTIILIKPSSSYYDKFLQRKKTEELLIEKAGNDLSYSVSVPIIQYQLTSSRDKRVLFTSLTSVISNALAKSIYANDSREHTTALALPLTNSVVQRIHLKDFMFFSLFRFFDTQRIAKSTKSSPCTSTSLVATSVPSSIRVYQRITEKFLKVLIEFKDYYYDLIASIQSIASDQKHSQYVTAPPLLHQFTLSPESSSSSVLPSYGVMRVFPRSNRGLQFMSVDVPIVWGEASYYEKCEILVSNVVYPIEDFLSSRQLSSQQDQQKNVSSRLDAILQSIHTTEDVLSLGEELDASSVRGEEVFGLSWKRFLASLIERYNNREGLELLASSSGSNELESEMLVLLLELLRQRYEVLYPVIKEYYSSSTSDKYGLKKDFDFLYYQSPNSKEIEKDEKNPFALYCSLETHPSEIMKEWKLNLFVRKTDSSKKEKKRKSREDEETSEVALTRFSNKALNKTPQTVDRTGKRSFESVYDTPTIGADWALLQANRDKEHLSPSELLENSLKKRRKQTVSIGSMSPQRSPSFSANKRKSPFSPRSPPSSKQTDTVVDVLALKKQLSEQTQSSKRFLQQLQDQLLNWN